MRVTILGSGTSSGVPVVGCNCDVCRSDDPRDDRMRASAWLELDNGRALLIDTSTDLRQQCLRFGVRRVDAVLFTHAHADHLHGIDELRLFNLWQQAEIPCYAEPGAAERIRLYLGYIFDPGPAKSFRPGLALHEVQGCFEAAGARVQPVPLMHGDQPVFGYRIGGFAYLTDVSEIPDLSWSLLGGLDLLVLDALRQDPHPTHFSLDEALVAAARIGAGRTVLTHISHRMRHAEINKALPDGVDLAYDGMRLEV
ncbi:MAG: MBL fold metallo-hydrolase [Deltaproteobacteria bacterium]|nr:MBL fold metallo-hydrolase [Deltaproteobacteria bacterium]